MAATKQDIQGWLERAKVAGNTHMVVVCDTYDHEDYPVFLTVQAQEELDRKIVECRGSMQSIMEVYALHLPIEDQLREYRANHPVIAPKASER